MSRLWYDETLVNLGTFVRNDCRLPWFNRGAFYCFEVSFPSIFVANLKLKQADKGNRFLGLATAKG